MSSLSERKAPELSLNLSPAMDANKSSAIPRRTSMLNIPGARRHARPLTSNSVSPPASQSAPSSKPTPGPIPALTISDAAPSSDNSTSTETLPARPLTAADISVPPLGPGPVATSHTFHATLSSPAFWERVHALCRDEFAEEKDGDACWKAFLDGIKGRLSAGEVAKIIDVVGVTGMGGNAV
ncbi:hypothetical protein NliqN6_0380 [Naganishia liquefaciens]|uniref:Uncharacterized protein n=1 Tax=Naganishia liquefaciens TaxID=104408 RepID=A0A8H3YCA3_9TREE|nr:hypothetical protein NliqN6_0380 [Naganishia liquefaciens]